jgi:hypothetical protein
MHKLHAIQLNIYLATLLQRKNKELVGFIKSKGFHAMEVEILSEEIRVIREEMKALQVESRN